MKHRFNTLRFEANDGLDPGAEGGAPPPDDAPAQDTQPEAPEVDYGQIFNSPDFQRGVGEAVMQTLGAMAEQGGGDEEEELDLYGADPGEFRQNLQGMIQREIQGAIDPILPAVQQMEVANWQEKIDRQVGELETVKQIDQSFPEDHPSEQGASILVERLATAFLPEMRSLYNDDDRAIQASLRAAADYALPIVKAAHAAGYAARGAELQRLSGAPTPPPQQGGEAQLLEEPEDEMAALARYAERHNLR